MKTEETKSDTGQEEWTTDNVAEIFSDAPTDNNAYQRLADAINFSIAKVREERDALDNTLTGSNELNALLQKTLATERAEHKDMTEVCKVQLGLMDKLRSQLAAAEKRIHELTNKS